MSYAGSEYTVYDNPYINTNDFVKNPDFLYGSRSDGTLAVPSGQSYMKFTSIDTGSLWHGPIYTQTLDRPFRLYQLDEFSATLEMVQSSSTMGKMYIALFDENKQCALLIYMGDAWVGSTKGYFKVIYYPQNGGSYVQDAGYIYTSFTKTGKLWWDPFQGGDGAIMASIDGSGSSYPIGEVDNASRVIKYVGILGYRYSSYNLVDMRIHDINLVCDLNEHNPNAPTAPPPSEEGSGTYDGTTNGLSQGCIVYGYLKILLDVARFLDKVDLWWTGPWPRIHARFSIASPSGPEFTLQITTDLLMNVEFEQIGFEVNMPNNPINDPDFWDRIDMGFVTGFLSTWGLTIAIWLLGAVTGKLCQMSTISTSLLAATLASLAAYVTLVIYDIASTASRAFEVYDNPLDRFFSVLVKGILSLFGWSVISIMLPFGWSRLKNTVENFGEWVLGQNDLSWMFIGIKFALTIMTFLAACYVGGLSLVGIA